jgi:hypothetical protein
MAEKDWVTPVAVFGGGVALATGAILLFKGKPTIKPGQKLNVKFSFEYYGPVGNYMLRVALGNIIGWTFSTEESSIQDFPILLDYSTSWVEYEDVVIYAVPSVLSENIHDAEFSIRYANGSIVSGQRVLADNIINMG